MRKKAGPVLALLVGLASLSAYGVRPPALASASRPASRHACCCIPCPGPGLCPCDPGSSKERVCVKSTDESPAGLGSAPAVPLLKLACEVPFEPCLPEPGASRCGVGRSFHSVIQVRPSEKVPISLA